MRFTGQIFQRVFAAVFGGLVVGGGPFVLQLGDGGLQRRGSKGAVETEGEGAQGEGFFHGQTPFWVIF